MRGFPVLNREEFQAIYDSGPDAAFALFQGLLSQVSVLEARVSELESRLSKDSHNSGKPPSTDGLKRKPVSLRGKSGKKSGGQAGHPGKTLSQRSDPDRVISHAPQACGQCGGALSEADAVEDGEVGSRRGGGRGSRTPTGLRSAAARARSH